MTDTRIPIGEPQLKHIEKWCRVGMVPDLVVAHREALAAIDTLLDTEEALTRERDASRTAHAALVADLREARTWLDVATDNLTDSGDGTYVAVSESLAKVAALLDRHAPEEGS